MIRLPSEKMCCFEQKVPSYNYLFSENKIEIFILLISVTLAMNESHSVRSFAILFICDHSWVSSCAPGRWILRDGPTAKNTEQINWAKPLRSKNWPPIAIVFEMMQTETSHRRIERIWKAKAIRKNKTNFFVRWSEPRDESEVKWDATSRIGS